MTILNSEFLVLNEKKSPALNRRRFGSSFRIAALLVAALFMAACTTTKTDPDPKDEPEIKPDQEIITGELQSDFLELGPAAGVQWLSFYPDDFLEYPELFEGLDADQRRRTRLAPREGANKVLFRFTLPDGSKIKPVDWYGTECVAIDLPDAKGFTVSLRSRDKSSKADELAQQRAAKLRKLARFSGKTFTTNGGGGSRSNQDGPLSESSYTELRDSDGALWAVYGELLFLRESTAPNVVVEAYDVGGAALPDTYIQLVDTLLRGIKVNRELALEGSPKHQCSSSVEDLKAGIVKYEKGGLTLALPEGWELRKSGGSSTVEIHGGGAKPLALIRKLKSQTNGTFKARISADTVFARRRARPDGFFSAGRALTDKEPYVIAFDYKDKSQEQVALCVIATGNELLTVEIISTGVIEGEARRKLRDQVLEMLAKAEPSAIVRNRVPELNELVGWKPKE